MVAAMTDPRPVTDAHAELTRLAKAATPGPWRASEERDEGDWRVRAADPDGMWWTVVESGHWDNYANAVYIAAAHPQAVLG